MAEIQWPLILKSFIQLTTRNHRLIVSLNHALGLPALIVLERVHLLDRESVNLNLSFTLISHTERYLMIYIREIIL